MTHLDAVLTLYVWGIVLLITYILVRAGVFRRA